MTEEETYGKHHLFVAFREAGKRLGDTEGKTRESRILWEQNGSSGELYRSYNKCIEEFRMASKEYEIAWKAWAEERKKIVSSEE